MSITTNCMTANISIGAWSGQRLDKGASVRLTRDAGADADAARVNKHLVPKDSLKDIGTCAGQLRTLFNTCTLPWKDNGDRLLTRKMYPAFISQFEEVKAEFRKAVDRFVDVTYPSDIAKAEFRMGDLFNPSDFPAASDLRRRFYVTLDIGAITEAGDFRVALDQDQADRIRARIESENTDRIARAMGDVWTRLNDTLTHFAETMKDENKIFRDSTIHNLADIVELIPALNIMNDTNLVAIYKDLKSTLIGLSPKDLRKDPDVRSAAADEAQRIVDSMAGFMQAFQPRD